MSMTEMPTPVQENVSILSQIQKGFQEQNLPMPFIPSDLENKLKCLEADSLTFCTKAINISLYDLHYYADRAFDQQPNYLLIGIAGHGVNSWALHYYLHYNKLTLFLKLAWGGIYMNKEQALSNIQKTFAQIQKYIEYSTTLPENHSLIQIIDNFYKNQYTIYQQPNVEQEENEWKMGSVLLAVNSNMNQTISDITSK